MNLIEVKGALGGELTKIESQYTSHDLVDHLVRPEPTLASRSHAFSWEEKAWYNAIHLCSVQCKPIRCQETRDVT